MCPQFLYTGPKNYSFLYTNLGRDPFVETGFGFESETGFSFGMYVKQTILIQPVSMDS